MSIKGTSVLDAVEDSPEGWSTVRVSFPDSHDKISNSIPGLFSNEPANLLGSTGSIDRYKSIRIEKSPNICIHQMSA
jgi:hypothetical protein